VGFFEEFGARPEEPVKPLPDGSFPDVVAEFVRTSAAVPVDVHMRDVSESFSGYESSKTRYARKLTMDGRRRPGWITPEGDVQERLSKRIVRDLLSYLHVVLLFELEEVFFSAVRALETCHLAWSISFRALILRTSIASSSMCGRCSQC